MIKYSLHVRTKRCVAFFLALAGGHCVQAQTYTVFAAASLKESLTEIARQFEFAHPGTSVSINFGGSQQLAAQIRHGANVDVFLSAGREPLKGLSMNPGSQRTFATNSLVLVVPSDDRRIHRFENIDSLEHLVIADKAVPVGNYTLAMFDSAERRLGKMWRARMSQHIVSREQDVRSVLAKVELGEADGGIVYMTDVLAARGKVRAIPIPNAFQVLARYPSVTFGKNGKDFQKFLFNEKSQKTFVRFGFGSPLVPSHPPVLEINHQEVPFGAGTMVITRFTAKDHQSTKSYLGYDVRSWLRQKGAVITLTGADDYSVELKISGLRSKYFYIVPSRDGNFQAIFPQLSPKTWVQWLRKVTIR